ncbi:hypothetical protein FSW04_22955 [Baekduia soli]|uniref:Uncharacterized protein n=1 Tax=Baekduia soli TaxID=496014 RepID=A0A5B8UBX8_9ACTN|nr:hypothetical protein [Baekduia soli]QEC50151.1 hypothetical protein FSW04_22955 [Baekduia soli]
MITRLRRAFGVLAAEQRRVLLAAVLVLVSMLLPWYSKTTTGFQGNTIAAQHEAKLAIFVPSFVEASIFLVAIALIVLMFRRGERSAFHLPFGDGVVVTAAGAWVSLLVFYRFVDQPRGGTTRNLVYTYDLSWGIFFGLLAGAFLIYAGQRLRTARLPEPGAPGEAPTQPDRRARPRERPPRDPFGPPPARPPGEPDPAAAATTRVPRAPRPREPDDGTAPTERHDRRPEIDGGTQLSFDEQE